MKDFKTMTKKTTPKKKMLAGVTAVVALSGFVPAINAASPTATANVGVSVLIQQAITLVAGANVDFGTLILSATTIVGAMRIWATDGLIGAQGLTGEVSFAGTAIPGTMGINSSAGAVNIAVGATITDNGGNIFYDRLQFHGTALSTYVDIDAGSNANVTLQGSTLKIGAWLHIAAKPTPGTYNTAAFTVTVTDI